MSVRPEVFIYPGGSDYDEGERRLDGIKLYLSKQHPLNQHSADTHHHAFVAGVG